MVDRSKLDSVIAEIEAAAYQRGVDDTLRTISGTVQKLRNEIVHAQVSAARVVDIISNVAASENGHALRRQPRAKSGQAHVLQMIREKPGHRGVDLVQLLEAAGTPVNERTLRTALIRLRQRGAIHQVQDRWYADLSLGDMAKNADADQMGLPIQSAP